MGKIKNQLTTFFKTDNIPSLIDYTTKNYRPYDPGQYLYRLVAGYPNRKKFSDEFIELTYTTLISWNMNQRGAKLSDFATYRKSLIEHKQTIELFMKDRIEKFTDIDLLMEKINFLFEHLQLVADGKPKLVTFSKTLHYFLPNLLIPIDRTYTLKLFYNNNKVPKLESEQLLIYREIFEQFSQLAKIYDFKKYIDKKWNKNIPKIIDNIIIAHTLTN